MHCVEHWAKKFRKHRPKACSKHVGTLWETIKSIFWTLKFFRFFWNFSKARPSMEQWEKNFSFQKSPKTRLDTWERFGQFKNFEIFLIFFLNLFYISTSNFKSGKPNSNFLSPENWPHIFKSRKSEKPCMEHLAKKLGKIASKHVQNTFGHFWRRLWSIWNFENLLIFFEIFQNPTLHGTRGFFFKKNATKHVQNKFGHLWKRFWAFFGILNFFLKICQDSTPHGTLNNFFCRKKMPQNTFGHLGTILDNFRTLNFFSLFPWNFSKSLPQNLSPENRTHFFKSWKLIS